MPSKKTNNYYQKKNDYTVYVICHPLTKQFYVHYCTTSALRNAMKQHYTLNNMYTKKMFQTYKETIYPPEMYALVEGEMTREQCYIKEIIWIRFFLDNKFVALNHDDEISSALTLFEENIKEYEQIEKLEVEKVLSKANRRFPHYGREQLQSDNLSTSKTRKQVNFYCEQDEYDLIKQNAKKRNQTVSAFIRDVSMNIISVDFNYNAVQEHTKEIRQLKSELYAVIQMLVTTNQAYPVDVEKIITILQKIEESEKSMVKKIIKERQEVNKKIKNILEN